MKNGGGSGRALGAGVYGALALALYACTDEIDSPSAGQTGSPVSPDHETPGQFRPPPQNPPASGPENPRPWRPLPGIEQAASFGDWLYVSTPRGLYAFDTRAEGATPVPVLNDARVPWLRVEGSTLDLVAEGLSDDPVAFDQGLVTRVQRFELTSDPARPTLLGSVELPGRFVKARVEGARLVILTGDPDVARCTAENGWQRPYQAERMIVSELARQGETWSVERDLNVSAIGFVEAENGFVLVDFDYSENRRTLTAVEITPEGIGAWPALSIAGEPLSNSAMALAGRRLALFQNDPVTGTELSVYDTDTGNEIGALAVTPSAIWDGVDDAVFDGPFALLPQLQSGERGLIVDWQGEAGPRALGELPPDLGRLERVGQRWLGRGSERFVLFHLDDAGVFQLEAQAAAPAEATRATRIGNDGTRLVVPYVVAAREQWLGSLDLGAPGLSWQAGARLTGNAAVYTPLSLYESLRPGVSVASTERGSFVLTTTGDITEAHWLLERIDLGAERSEVVAFGERALATSAQGESQVTLLGSYEETRRLRVRHEDGSTAEIALGNGAEQLSSFGDGLLASSLEYSNACYRGTSPRYAAPCLPAGNPALAVISLDPPSLVSEATLPVREADIPGAPFSREWLEVVAQGERVGVLEHSSIVCRTRAACETLGVPFDPRGPADSPSSPEQAGVGSQNQRWLHAYHSESGGFDAPVHLFDVDGHGWLSAENLRVEADAGAALTLFTPLVLNPNGSNVDSARIELVRYRDLSSAALNEPTRITVPGYPLYVGARSAVTIEPAGQLGADGAAPNVLVHHLALDGEVAYIEQTLELGTGATGYRWADVRGYVLLMGDDRCADPTSTLVSVRLVDNRLEEAGRITLPGTSWQLRNVSDSVALLARGLEGLVQHAVVDAAERELSLREYRTYPETAPVNVWEDRVWFDTGP